MLSIKDHLKKDLSTKNIDANTRGHRAFTSKPMWRHVLKQEALKLLSYLAEVHNRPCEQITIVFMDQQEMEALARKFQLPHHHQSDVLTFSYQESPEAPIEGDILLCPKLIFEAASEAKHSPSYALIETLLHGMLHLYGFEHSYTTTELNKIYRKQKTILTNLNINWKKLHELVQPA